MKYFLSLAFVASISFSTQAQLSQKQIVDWYNEGNNGMRTDLAYKKLLKGKTPKKVVVGVIDSGVDIEHEDLQGKIWVNADEIPNNGKDDDNNGYIDDIHGWNYLGNANGENANHAQLEVTRIYARHYDAFHGLTSADVKEEDREHFELFKSAEQEVMESRKKAEASITNMKGYKTKMEESHNAMVAKFGSSYGEKEIKKAMKMPEMVQVAQMASGYLNKEEVFPQIERAMEYYQGQLDFYYNKDYTEDRDIVGDKPSDFSDKTYGNNDVEGPDALHGTHVAGIIGATRDNKKGGDGVAPSVEIMSLRAVPDGDERDKDIALAIRYAVDNGAQVINMSFGKDWPENSAEVIKAIRYAQDKDVLMVHAAGNDGKNVDEHQKYPSSIYPSMKTRFPHWLDIGASTYFEETTYFKSKRKPFFALWKKREKSLGYGGLAASFSNYGKTNVDVFAPGQDIWNTIPQSEYKKLQGTSMAAPMVSGVAALLKAYFPSLSMMQIKDIILKSARTMDVEVMLPGDKTKTKNFSQLSRTGAVVDVYSAVEMAMEMTK